MLVTRMFTTDGDATDAVNDLRTVGFRAVAIKVIDKTAGEVSEASLKAQGVSELRARTYADAIDQGGTLVIVDAPFGAGPTAKEILEQPRAHDTGEHPAEYETATVPSSSSSSSTVPGTSGEVDWTSATPLSSKFGWPVLLDDPAPLSKWMNWRTLSDPPTTKPTSHGLPFLSDDPAPLSSKLGLKVLSDSKPSAALSDDPAPLSTRLGRPVLLDNPTPLSSWLGWRVLLDDPTPLSSRLNWPVLSGPRASKP